MPRKSEASSNRKGGGKGGDAHWDDMSIDLGPNCTCCCGAACSGHCGCHDCMGQITHRTADDTQSTYPGEGGCAVPAEPRNINHPTTDFAVSHPMDCMFSLGNNSVEAARPLLTYANLAQHTSSSLEQENRLEHLHRCVEDEDDPNPGERFLSLDEDFLPAGEMDEQPLEESVIVQLELASDHRSMLSGWDRSFSRSSPSASIYLRDVGTRYYFIRSPLPLLEEHNHGQATSCRCECDG